MQVRELMTKGIDAVNPATTVREAAKRMKELQTSLLPVVTETGLIGMLTARDIAVRVAAEGRDPRQTTVEDVMSLGVIVCFEDQKLEEALDRMMSKRVSHLPVLDRKRRLVGRISLEDFVFQPKGRTAVEHVLQDPHSGQSEVVEPPDRAGAKPVAGMVFSMGGASRP
jgi:CBS domain-containing protein